MANPVKGEASLVLADGRAFTLVLDMEALIAVEQTYGKPLHEVMGEATRGFLGAIAAIAQAAFLRHHPEITRADVLDMVASDRDALTVALGKASDAAFADTKKARPAGNGKRDRAGKGSGRNGARQG